VGGRASFFVCQVRVKLCVSGTSEGRGDRKVVGRKGFCRYVSFIEEEKNSVCRFVSNNRK
jgi:hypothetical protein